VFVPEVPFGVVQVGAEIIIKPQTTLQASIYVFVIVRHGMQTDTTFDFLLLISVCNLVLWLR
jgi:hypothetical protein